LSGTRTTAPAVKVVASATDEAVTTTMAAPMGGASHLANGSLDLDLMLMTSSLLQSVTTRQDDAPPILHALRLRAAGHNPNGVCRTSQVLRSDGWSLLLRMAVLKHPRGICIHPVAL
jgi:hypothetical protein